LLILQKFKGMPHRHFELNKNVSKYVEDIVPYSFILGQRMEEIALRKISVCILSNEMNYALM
jgi:hypothetical protein